MTKKKKKPNEKLKSSSGTPLEIWEIEWADHTASRGGWQDYVEWKPTIVLCKTLGYKVYEDKEVVTLALTQSNNGNISDMMTIIKKCIIKKKQIC